MGALRRPDPTAVWAVTPVAMTAPPTAVTLAARPSATRRADAFAAAVAAQPARVTAPSATSSAPHARSSAAPWRSWRTRSPSMARCARKSCSAWWTAARLIRKQAAETTSIAVTTMPAAGRIRAIPMTAAAPTTRAATTGCHTRRRRST